MKKQKTLENKAFSQQCGRETEPSIQKRVENVLYRLTWRSETIRQNESGMKNSWIRKRPTSKNFELNKGCKVD